MRALCTAVLGICLSMAGPLRSENLAQGEVYTFGIVPQQSASRLAKMWGPLLKELSAQTGATFLFRTTKDIPTFEACLSSGAYDVAYMNPMHYAIFSEQSDYRAIARQADKRLKGLIVARSGSGIEEIGNLDSQTIAFPSPGAFGASILTRSALSSHGVSFEPSYVKSHDSVYRAVAAGLMQAGGGVSRTLGSVDPEVRAQLSIIYETESFTPHAIAVLGEVGTEFATSVQEALIAVAQTNPDVVKGIGMRGFEVAQDTDWDDVRALGMTHEETGISRQGDVQCPSD